MARITKQESVLIWTGVAAAGFFWLASNPNCKRGCKTVAQHLAEHALEDFLGGLGGFFAA